MTAAQHSADAPAPTVAVVGGGASGVIASIHLAHVAAQRGLALHLVLIEPGEPGRGVAYSTRDSEHRLNVPAARMSAWQHDPDHFVSWVRHGVAADFPAGGSAPRPWYAHYLRATLDSAVAGAPGCTLRQLRTRADRIHPAGGGYQVQLGSGATLGADVIVLATGHGAPATTWAPPALARSARFVADPWAVELPVLPSTGTALLVGSGLTMADVARTVSRDGARLHVVSRHGLLPLAHAERSALPAEPPDLPLGVRLTVAELRHRVFAHVRALDGDWRRAVDSLRPVTTQLWSALPPNERAQLIATSGRRWDRVRHRVDAQCGSWLESRVADGLLLAHAGTVVGAVEAAEHIEVRLSSGAVIAADLVVNCTGPSDAVQRGENPLLNQLIDDRLARPGPLRMGLATRGDGRLLPAAGAPEAIWTLGPLRRGELWESTAIPEIRAQSAELARSLINALPRTLEHTA